MDFGTANFNSKNSLKVEKIQNEAASDGLVESFTESGPQVRSQSDSHFLSDSLLLIFLTDGLLLTLLTDGLLFILLTDGLLLILLTDSLLLLVFLMASLFLSFSYFSQMFSFSQTVSFSS